MITDSGIIIRTPASDISTYSRTASGVIVMRLLEGQKVVNITKTVKEDEDEAEEIIDENGDAVEVTAEASQTQE
jgi:DNA gyrase subunit A